VSAVNRDGVDVLGLFLAISYRALPTLPVSLKAVGFLTTCAVGTVPRRRQVRGQQASNCDPMSQASSCWKKVTHQSN